jgi:KaiC/GvpD/RAD55 family RecA-like ATPase
MIPTEIKQFFAAKFGTSLLVKGKPGTGKTTFVFEILNDLCPEGNCIYISPRVDQTSPYGNYSWIEGDFNNSEEFLNMLDTRIRMIREGCEEKPLIVVDSIDSLSIATTRSLNWLANKFELERRLTDFARKVNSDILMVTEQVELDSLDYLVDGVVYLERTDIAGHDIRKIHLNKLRGVSLSQSKYPFTLQNGRFKSFGSFRVSYPSETIIPEPVQDPVASKISTGIPDFDRILGGGYQKGSFNLFEMKSGVGDSFYSLLLPTFINHLNLERAMFCMPSEGTSVETERSMITPFSGVHRFKDQFVGFDTRERDAKVVPYVEPLTGNISTDMEAIQLVKMNLMNKFGQPVLDYIGLDTMEYNYGSENVGKVIGQWASRTKTTQNVVLAVAKFGQKIIESVAHMATTHWKFENIDRTLLLYGVVPKTGVYVVEMDFEMGHPQVKLTPVI